MKKEKKLLGAAVCGLIVVGLTTGCSSNSPSNSPSNTSKQVTTVSIWSWTPVDATMKKIVAAIEKKHPNIHIETNISPHAAYNTSLAAAASSGSLPDIIGLPAGSQTQQYRPDLQPMDPIAKELWGNNWESNFPASAIKQATLGNPSGDNHLYMIPQETQVTNVWYNKKIFQQLNLSVPTTLDELIANSKKISAAGYIPFFQGAAAVNFNSWLFDQIAAQTDMSALQSAQRGGSTWAQPGMVQAATIWKKMFDSGVFEQGAVGAQQYPTGANLFAAGRVGMILLGSWWLQEAALPTSPSGLKSMADFGTFAFPAVEAGGSPTPPLGGIDFGWGLTKNAGKNAAVQTASKTVLKELVSGVGEQIMINDLNDLPAFKGFKPQTKYSSDVMAIYSKYLTLVDGAQNHLFGNPTVEQALTTNLQNIALGKVTPAQAMANVQASVKP